MGVNAVTWVWGARNETTEGCNRADSVYADIVLLFDDSFNCGGSPMYCRMKEDTTVNGEYPGIWKEVIVVYLNTPSLEKLRRTLRGPGPAYGI